MKEKKFHFIVAILIYGTIGYFIVYFTQAEQNPWLFTFVLGISMAIFNEVFFRKNKINKP